MVRQLHRIQARQRAKYALQCSRQSLLQIQRRIPARGLPGSDSRLVRTSTSASSWLRVVQTGITFPTGSSSETAVVARISRTPSAEYFSVLIYTLALHFAFSVCYFAAEMSTEGFAHASWVAIVISLS